MKRTRDFEVLRLKWPLLSRLKNLCRRGRMFKSQKKWTTQGNSIFQKQQDWWTNELRDCNSKLKTYESSNQVRISARKAQNLSPKKLFAIDKSQERKKICFLQCSDIGYINYTPRQASCLEIVGQHKTTPFFCCCLRFFCCFVFLRERISKGVGMKGESGI